MSRGKRCDEPKLNMKKVVATVVAIVVVIMVIISIKGLLTSSKMPKTQEVSVERSYFSAYTNEKWGVIDNTGNTVIPINYAEMVIVPDQTTDLFICTYDEDYDTETYKTKVLNKENQEILTNYENIQAIENTDGTDIWYENNVLTYKENEKYGLIDFSGKKILDAEYDKIYALEGAEKNLIIEKNGQKGIVNTSMGEIVVSTGYTEVKLLTDSYEDGYIVQKDGKCGIISANSQVIFEPTYEKIENVSSNGYYVVVQNGKTELVDKSGKVILDTGFDTIEKINGENLVVTVNGKYGVIDINNNKIIDNEYEDLRYVFSTYYIAKKDGKYGVISTDGVTVVDFNYTSMEYIKNAGFIEADKENYKTDLIDKDFNIALSDIIISELNVESGYIRVREDDEYVYYNFNFEKKTNHEVLPTSTLFLVKELGKYGYENKNGEKVVDCIYDDAKEQNKYGYCAVKKDGKWGVLKSDGTVVLEPTVDLEDYLYIDFVGDWHLSEDISINVYTK